MKIGIIKEGKIPRDARVALTPEQCAQLIKTNSDLKIVVQPCSYRCYKDEEYISNGIEVSNEIADCDILIGIKEVPIDLLIPNKTYLFFSHTIKKQAHNKRLLQTLLQKNIRMIDYEVLCDQSGERVIAFGRWAGIVGAHNGIWAYGKRYKTFELPRMYQSFDYETVKKQYANLNLGHVKIVLTGTGRVANGAAETLSMMNIKKVEPNDFLNQKYEYPVFTQLKSSDMYQSKFEQKDFDKNDFHKNPENYKSIFNPYIRVADIMINGIYWNKKAPVFFTAEDMCDANFKIKTIADITCDVMPDSSIPSTLYATTITEPVFGYNPITREEEPPYANHVIDMMTIDNLPNELPRDASKNFGEQLIKNVIGNLQNPKSEMINRATICIDGRLNTPFEYLSNYAGL